MEGGIDAFPTATSWDNPIDLTGLLAFEFALGAVRLDLQSLTYSCSDPIGDPYCVAGIERIWTIGPGRVDFLSWFDTVQIEGFGLNSLIIVSSDSETCHGPPCTATGDWIAVAEAVPEPPALLLMLAGLMLLSVLAAKDHWASATAATATSCSRKHRQDKHAVARLPSGAPAGRHPPD